MNIWQDSNNAVNNSIPNSSTASEGEIIKLKLEEPYWIDKKELQSFNEFYRTRRELYAKEMLGFITDEKDSKGNS